MLFLAASISPSFVKMNEVPIKKLEKMAKTRPICLSSIYVTLYTEDQKSNVQNVEINDLNACGCANNAKADDCCT